MNREEQEDHFKHFTYKMKQTLVSKGDDYAGETNRLANFQRVGAITNTSTASACLTLIATKVARLGVLLNSGTEAKNESVRDSILDLANYAVLLDAIVSEHEPVKAAAPETEPPRVPDLWGTDLETQIRYAQQQRANDLAERAQVWADRARDRDIDIHSRALNDAELIAAVAEVEADYQKENSKDPVHRYSELATSDQDVIEQARQDFDEAFKQALFKP
jgi:hypothetical protein